MPINGKTMTDALLARAKGVIGQTFIQGDASIVIHEARSVQAPTLNPVPIYGNGAGLCLRLTYTVAGVELISSDTWCVLLSHEIPDLSNAQQLQYLKERLAAFAGA